MDPGDAEKSLGRGGGWLFSRGESPAADGEPRRHTSNVNSDSSFRLGVVVQSVHSAVKSIPLLAHVAGGTGYWGRTSNTVIRGKQSGKKAALVRGGFLMLSDNVRCGGRVGGGDL